VFEDKKKERPGKKSVRKDCGEKVDIGEFMHQLM
jgi:hypothetical protein